MTGEQEVAEERKQCEREVEQRQQMQEECADEGSMGTVRGSFCERLWNNQRELKFTKLNETKDIEVYLTMFKRTR